MTADPTHPTTETAEAIAERCLLAGVTRANGLDFRLDMVRPAIADAIRAERASTSSRIAAAREEGRREALNAVLHAWTLRPTDKKVFAPDIWEAALEAIRSLADRPSHPMAESGWRPMSIAPKDGTVFQARRVQTRRVLWSNAMASWNTPSGRTLYAEDYFDGWMPLTAPPSTDVNSDTASLDEGMR